MQLINEEGPGQPNQSALPAHHNGPQNALMQGGPEANQPTLHGLRQSLLNPAARAFVPSPPAPSNLAPVVPPPPSRWNPPAFFPPPPKLVPPPPAYYYGPRNALMQKWSGQNRPRGNPPN